MRQRFSLGIPTRAQWKAWSLPSKVSYLGFWLGLASLVLAGIPFMFHSAHESEVAKAALRTSPDAVADARFPTANLLQNAGFEEADERGELLFGPDNPPRLWCCGDSVDTVGSQMAISPHGGARMLAFYAGQWSRSQTRQLVRLSLRRQAIHTGRVIAQASIFVNRYGAADPTFGLRVRAFAGDPSQHHGRLPALADITKDLSTDADPTTWERLDTVMTVPAAAEYLAVEIYALGNFDKRTLGGIAHYADDAFLRLAD